MSNEYKDWQADEIHDLRQQLSSVTNERDELVAALSRIASSRVVDIAQSALAKLGADKTGWKLVPVEPTLEMKMAASDYMIEHQHDEFYAEDIYKVMVAKVGTNKDES